MDFLRLEGKRILIFGVANRKSVAWHIAKTLTEVGAECVYVVQNETVRDSQQRLLGEADVHICDVEQADQITQLRENLAARYDCFHGLVHSLAFADYSDGMKPFHETPRKAFLQAVDISCYSLIAVSNALKDLLDRRCVGRDDLDIDDPHGQRKLRLHGTGQGRSWTLRWPSWPSRSASFPASASTPSRPGC